MAAKKRCTVSISGSRKWTRAPGRESVNIFNTVLIGETTTATPGRELLLPLLLLLLRLPGVFPRRVFSARRERGWEILSIAGLVIGVSREQKAAATTSGHRGAEKRCTVRHF